MHKLRRVELLLLQLTIACNSVKIKQKYYFRSFNLTAILLIGFVVQVNAYSFAQKLSLSVKNEPLNKVLIQIRDQTGYDFIFTRSALDKTVPVTIQVSNRSIEEVLAQIFSRQPLDYKLQDKSIVITAKAEKQVLKAGNKDIIVRGKVVDENGNGLPGATVRLKGDDSKMVITSSSNGEFAVTVPGENAVLVVSYIGYQTKEVTVSGADVNLVIKMEQFSGELKGVTVVSTGYQDIPKERATGSFEKIDNELLNRSTGSSVLQRLENVTSGLLIDRRLSGSGKAGIGQVTIRGLNTMTPSMTAPLVVLDNFPYEGDINNINPNDIESVTILKDAAAASIWGARAGNGVIVITTKRGQYNKRSTISFNSNVNIMEKPDLMSTKIINSSDYIDLEKDLFGKGFYDNRIDDIYTWPYLSPVIELMLKARNGTISQSDANAQIDTYRNNDVRKDYLKYIYRPAIAQQYALNINGGGSDFAYQLSGGYDKNIANQVKENGNRITFRTALSYKPIRNLEVDFNLIYTQIKNQYSASQSPISYNPLSILPYARLIDNDGKPAVVGKLIGDRFLEHADPRFLDWNYRPLADIYTNVRTDNSYDWLMNLGAKYQLSKVFSASVRYQYTRLFGENRDRYNSDSFYARNYINSLTEFSGETVTRNLPVGGILQQSFINGNSYNIRGQINADKYWGDHQLNILVGAEQKENISKSSSLILYGYDDNTLTHSEVDHRTQFITPLFSYLSMPSGLGLTDQRNRFQSLFANAVYSFKNRYTISTSVRKDAANLYGVATNLRGAPFWSAGLSWNVADESFYQSKILPQLKLRVTYGYQGNTNNNLAAFSTILYSGDNDRAINLPYANIVNPANDALRWERIGTLNLGIDFGLQNQILSGSMEYYIKSAQDVLTLSPIDYTSGFLFATTNNARVKSNGFDFNIRSKIIQKTFQWNASLFFNYNNNKVTRFAPLNSSIDNYLDIVSAMPTNFIIGKPLLGIFAFKSAGLDSENGDPVGYLNGEKSKDYAALTSVPIDQLSYEGSAIPIYSGGFRHTFSYKKLIFSFNLIGKFGYVFRRPSIDYDGVLGSSSGSQSTFVVPHSDFELRWRQPGDELKTNVPSLMYPNDPLRNKFYRNSSVLISNADHIRLQDINLAYQFDKRLWGFKNFKIFAIASNLGILWRANKYHLDPDSYLAYPAQKIYSLGLNANF